MFLLFENDVIYNNIFQYKNEKNVILQAHPFRDGMVLANPVSIDGIEVFNFHINHNSRIGIAAQYALTQGFLGFLLCSAGSLAILELSGNIRTYGNGYYR